MTSTTPAPYRKKLIEVALPLEAINKASSREKSIRHGHPSTLHLWWARRPLAACRAVLFAQLVDDPSSDPNYLRDDGSVDEEAAAAKRAELFNIIEELVIWENSNNTQVINRARAEIARCVANRKLESGELAKDEVLFGSGKGKPHPNGGLSGSGVTTWEIAICRAKPEVVNAFLTEHAPPVLDPFCGGGSIPLEAQRLGLHAHASDLNPVPVLITKALIEIPPKFADQPPVHPDAEQRTGWSGATGLAEDVRYYGKWMRDQAEKRIGHLYPKVRITQAMIDHGRPDLEPYKDQELTVIAWLWARTVPSPDPSVLAKHVPLVRSFWLSKKKGKEAYVQPVIDKGTGEYQFRVRIGKPMDGFNPEKGTVVRTGATCLVSGSPLSFTHAREAGKRGEMKARLMAIVCEGHRGRVYVDPNEEHGQIADCGLPDGYPVSDVPHQALGFRVQLYGMDQHWKLFTPRQLTALTTFSDLVGEARAKVLADAESAGHLPDDDRPLTEGGTGPHAYADAVATYLAFALDKSANYWSSLCAWATPTQKMISTFGRQALPMVWDYAEANPFSTSTGNFKSGVKLTSEMVETTPIGAVGYVDQFDATMKVAYRDEIISSDPPYYDNIGYADLSDFFYVWLRRSLKHVYPQLLSTMLTPKNEEMIASPYRHGGSKAKAAAFFEEGLGSAIGQWRKHGHPEYPTTIFYAFKQAETTTSGTASTGWETFLTGVIEHGFTITGTWPVRTELTGNLKKNVAALASSIVLVCVPRATDASLATRREFADELRRELPTTIHTLQSGNIAPVDLAQASIGPGMAVFSRYSKVINADGSAMTVREALQLINMVLDEALSEQEADYDPWTRWAVKWFEQNGTNDGPYGEAETLSTAMAISVKGVVEAGIARSQSGQVQLLKRDELDPTWDPSTDNRLTIWEVTHYLVKSLEDDGEPAAAELLKKVGPNLGETARELAYRLYQISERKKWAREALGYNGLVASWTEIERLSRQAESAPQQKQSELFG